MEELRSFKTPLIISASVHLLFALFLLIDWGVKEHTKTVEIPHVKASLVTQDPFQQQKQKDLAEKRKKWEAERKRKADLERKRVVAEKKKIADKKRKEEDKKKKLAEKKRKEEAKKKAAAEKKKQEALALKKKEEARKKKEAEQKRLAEEKKKAEKLKAKKEEEELARQEAELAKQEQEAQERRELEALEKELAELERQETAKKQASARQEEMNNLFLQVIAIIQESVQDNWELPPGYDSQWNVVLRLHFQPDGDLRKVETVRSSGNSAFDRSAEQAAWRMGTIPEIRDLDDITFRKMQRIKLEFAPELDG